MDAGDLHDAIFENVNGDNFASRLRHIDTAGEGDWGYVVRNRLTLPCFIFAGMPERPVM